MYYIKIGTDTYGRVKAVSGTSIVTKFAMVNFLPLYPLESYYSFGTGEKKSQGVPLTRLDYASVAVAYLRGVFGTLAVFGSISFFSFVMWLLNQRFDEFAQYATWFLLACLVVGIIGGTLTYLIPNTSRRERTIRECCGEIVGVAVDPALVQAEFAQALADYAKDVEYESAVVHPKFADKGQFAMAKEMLQVRVEIALGNTDPVLERRTDELIERLPQSMAVA